MLVADNELKVRRAWEDGYEDIRCKNTSTFNCNKRIKCTKIHERMEIFLALLIKKLKFGALQI